MEPMRLVPTFVAFLASVAPAAALAAAPMSGAATQEPSLAIFFGEIVALIVVGRLVGELMERIGQPSVMGQLIGGMLLGPSVFGALFPSLQHALFPAAAGQKALLEAVSELGILLLLLLTG